LPRMQSSTMSGRAKVPAMVTATGRVTPPGRLVRSCGIRPPPPQEEEEEEEGRSSP
jgi:hypothetical protein